VFFDNGQQVRDGLSLCNNHKQFSG
jgi:hypothetical protein